MAGCRLRLCDSRFQVPFAVQGPHQLGDTDGACGRQIGRQTEGRESLDLVERPCRQHGVEAGIDGGVHLVSRRHQDDRQIACRIARRISLFALPVAERTARGGEHRGGPDQALAVAGRQSGGGFGVHGAKLGAERLTADVVEVRGHLRNHFRGHIGDRRQPVRQRLQVQTGAAGNHRHAAAGMDIRERRLRHFEPAPGRAAFRNAQATEQMVRYALHFGRPWARGEDAQVCIYLHAVRIDHLAVKLFGGLQGQIGFSARRRSGDDDNGR